MNVQNFRNFFQSSLYVNLENLWNFKIINHVMG